MRLKPACVTDVGASGQPELKCGTLSQKTSKQARKGGEGRDGEREEEGKRMKGKILKQASSFHNLTKTRFPYEQARVCWREWSTNTVHNAGLVDIAPCRQINKPDWCFP